MATRPTPGSRDGSRGSALPRSTSRGPTRPATSDPASCRRGRASLSPSPALASASSDKPVPSFLRPTVSSTLRSSSPSPSTRPPSSAGRAATPKGQSPAHRAPSPITTKRSPAQQQPASSPSPRPITPKRSPAQQPVSAPRPITPSMDKGKAKASTSRWSVASPKQLMQKASNVFKATNAFKVGKSRSKKGKDLDGAAATAVASVKEAPGASGAIKTDDPAASAVAPGASGDIKSDGPAASAVAPVKEASCSCGATKIETARAPPVPEPQRRPLEMTAAPPPDVVQAEVVVQPNAALMVLEEASSRSGEIFSTEIKTEDESRQEEQAITQEPRANAEKTNAIVEEKVLPDEPVEAVKVDKPVEAVKPAPEEKPQTSNVKETEKEAETETLDELPPAAVVQKPAKETDTPPPIVQHEPSASTVQEEAVVEPKAEEAPQAAEPAKHEEATKQPEASVLSSEEPKEQPAAAQKQAEAAEDPKTMAATRASSAPATALEEALEEADTMKAGTSQSEPVTPAKDNKQKAVIDTILSASAPSTPAKGGARKEGAASWMSKIPEEGRLSFKGSKVKTALEKRPEEDQPKKKEVTRSNDVLEEAKSKLLEKKKSKVKALVGAFEVVMDSPRASSTPGPGKATPR